MPSPLLPIYLEDHIAGAVAGVRVARRCAGENRGNQYGAVVEALVPELERQLGTARAVARAVGARPSAVKQLAAIGGELAGRLKLNGRLVGYSPLSRVVELEVLVLGSRGRASLWRVLQDLAPAEPALAGFDFAGLADTAERQLGELDELRRAAAREAFAPGAG